MGIFDQLKEKASELLSGATDKIAETTGVDVGGVTDQANQATENLTETAQGHAETAQGHAEAAQDHAGAFGDQVTDTTGVDFPTDKPN